MNLSIIDVLIVAVLLVASGLLNWQKHPFSRWGFAHAFCFLLAGLLTPADPMSTIVVGLGMSLCLTLGAWMKPTANVSV